MYKIIIIDYNGKHIEVKVSKEVYNVFVDLKKEETKMRNEEHRKWDMRGFDSFLSNQAIYASHSIIEEIIEREELRESEIQLQQLLDKIYFILNHCTEKQKERFLLYASHGYSQREIAKLQGCSQTAVRLSIEQVKKKFNALF